MEEQKRNIDEFFLEELGAATELPPSSVWTTLEKQLDHQVPRKRGIWWLIGSLFLFVLSGSVIGYIAYENKKEEHSRSGTIPASVGNGMEAQGNDSPVSADTLMGAMPARPATAEPAKDKQPGDTTAQRARRRGIQDKRNAVSLDRGEAQPLSTATGKDPVRTEQMATASKTGLSAGKESRNKTSGQAAGLASSGRVAGRKTSSGTIKQPDVVAANRKAVHPSADASGTIKDQKQGLDNDPSQIEHREAKRDKGAAASPIVTTGTAGQTTPRQRAAQVGARRAAVVDNQLAVQPGSKQQSQGSKVQLADKTGGAQRPEIAGGDSNTAQHPANKAANPAALRSAVHPGAKVKATAAAAVKTGGAQRPEITGGNSNTAQHAANKATKQAAAHPGAKATATGTVKAGGTQNPEIAGNDINTAKHPANEAANPAATTATAGAGDVGQKRVKQAPAPARNPLLIDTDRLNAEDDEAEHDPGTAEATTEETAAVAGATTSKARHTPLKVTDEQGRELTPEAGIRIPEPKVPDFLKVDTTQAAGSNTEGVGGGIRASGRSRPDQNKRAFEGGLKIGYEQGANNFTLGKFVASFYAQYNVSDKVGLVLQPAVKAGTTRQSYIMPQGNYYNIVRPTEVNNYATDSIGGGVIRSYAYSQVFDSMIATVNMERKSLEIDIPLMLRYQLTPNFAVMGGVNVTLGKIINLNSSVRTISGLTLRDTVANLWDTVRPVTPYSFEHRGSVPFSAYAAAEGLNPETNPLRIGYTLSLSYVVRDRILIDFLMQQTTSNLNHIPNREVRKLYSQPYMRFTVGYKLFGASKKKPR